MWQQKSQAFVGAPVYRNSHHSHNETQVYMETGTPGMTATASGWISRLLGVLPGPHLLTEALSLGTALPGSSSGPNVVANPPLGRNAGGSMLPCCSTRPASPYL